MHHDHISIPLGLRGMRVVRQEGGGDNQIRVVVVPTTQGAECPSCGRWCRKQHDTRARAKADEPLGAWRVTLVVLRRRFHCFACERHFTEPDPACGCRRRLTTRLRERLAEECTHQTVKQVAQTYQVSPKTVRRAFAEYQDHLAAVEPPPPPRVLGIDDFSIRKGQRYATGFHDLERHTTIEVVEGRSQAVVQPVLETLNAEETIAVVSLDMAKAYRAAVQEVLPDAAIVVDKFHVVKRVSDALHAVYRRLVQGKDRNDPLRKVRLLLGYPRECLLSRQRQTLDATLLGHPSLRTAYLLKEDLRRWYRQATPKDARLELLAWRRMVADLQDAPEFATLDKTFAEWQEEILAYFTHRVTQGIVEGKNNRAKVIERQAFGYRNFPNLRRRLLAQSPHPPNRR
jgi:transposase